MPAQSARVLKTVKTHRLEVSKSAPTPKKPQIKMQNGIYVGKEADKLWKLMSDYHKGASRPPIYIRQSKTYGIACGGHAKFIEREIVITVGKDASSSTLLMVIAHELAHIAAPKKYSSADGKYHGAHGERWATCYVKAVRKRFGAEHFTGVRASHGYAVDGYVLRGIVNSRKAELGEAAPVQQW